MKKIYFSIQEKYLIDTDKKCVELFYKNIFYIRNYTFDEYYFTQFVFTSII